MPHDAHPMGVLVSAMSTLSVFHPDANPALRVSKYVHETHTSYYFFLFSVLSFLSSVWLMWKLSLHTSIILNVILLLFEYMHFGM